MTIMCNTSINTEQKKQLEFSLFAKIKHSVQCLIITPTLGTSVAAVMYRLHVPTTSSNLDDGTTGTSKDQIIPFSGTVGVDIRQ